MAAGRLVLRPPRAADADAHFTIHGDPATNRFNPAGPITDPAESRAILDAWSAHWDGHGFGYWAVALRAAPDAVIGFGGIAFRPVGGEVQLNLYFRLSPTVWGRGLATELARPRWRARRRRATWSRWSGPTMRRRSPCCESWPSTSSARSTMCPARRRACCSSTAARAGQGRFLNRAALGRHGGPTGFW